MFIISSKPCYDTKGKTTEYLVLVLFAILINKLIDIGLCGFVKVFYNLKVIFNSA